MVSFKRCKIYIKRKEKRKGIRYSPKYQEGKKERAIHAHAPSE
jgi:hypothetical protein